MSIREYIEYWEKIIKNNYDYNEQLPILYLKDWHFFNDTKDYHMYQVPKYFESDFLNEYCVDNNLTDYKFVYMGPKGSRFVTN